MKPHPSVITEPIILFISGISIKLLAGKLTGSGNVFENPKANLEFIFIVGKSFFASKSARLYYCIIIYCDE